MKAPVTYIEGLVKEPSVVMNWLWTDLPWENREGAPRRECWFNLSGAPYTYGSGEHARTYQAHPLDGDRTDAWMIEQIRLDLSTQTGASYNCCFVNGYAHGRQHLGWHADDSPEMDMDHPIATVSLGAEQEIWFRKRSGDGGFTNQESLTLAPGSAAIMAAGIQRIWQHRIPKSPLGDACGARISLTYRMLV